MSIAARWPDALGVRPLRTGEAYEALAAFADEYGRDALRLLMHAVVPETLRPDLLHLIRLNFMTGTAGPAGASLEADVLFAPLTTALGGGYYRIDGQVRWHALMLLRSAYRDDVRGRHHRVAELLWRHLDQLIAHGTAERDPALAEYIEVQRWVALATLQPEAAAQALAVALKQQADTPGGVRARLGSLAAAVELPLAGQPALLAYARGLDALAQGDADEARRRLGSLLGESLSVGDVVLPPLREKLAAALAGRNAQSAQAVSSTAVAPPASATANRGATAGPRKAAGKVTKKSAAKPLQQEAGGAARAGESPAQRQVLLISGQEFDEPPRQGPRDGESYMVMARWHFRRLLEQWPGWKLLVHWPGSGAPAELIGQILSAHLVVVDLDRDSRALYLLLGIAWALRRDGVVVVTPKGRSTVFGPEHELQYLASGVDSPAERTRVRGLLTDLAGDGGHRSPLYAAWPGLQAPRIEDRPDVAQALLADVSQTDGWLALGFRPGDLGKSRQQTLRVLVPALAAQQRSDGWPLLPPTPMGSGWPVVPLQATAMARLTVVNWDDASPRELVRAGMRLALRPDGTAFVTDAGVSDEPKLSAWLGVLPLTQQALERRQQLQTLSADQFYLAPSDARVSPVYRQLPGLVGARWPDAAPQPQHPRAAIDPVLPAGPATEAMPDADGVTPAERAERLARQHGLTLAERDVLAGLLTRHAVEQIARGRGVKLWTVRTQLASIQAKLGASSLDEVLRMGGAASLTAEAAAEAVNPEGAATPSPVPPPKAAPKRVFVSYSRAYADIAVSLADAMTSLGLDVYLDTRLPAGSDWRHQLADWLDAADALVAVAGRHTAGSVGSMAEIANANKRKLLILPVIVDGWDGLSEELTSRQAANVDEHGALLGLGTLKGADLDGAIARSAQRIAAALREAGVVAPRPARASRPGVELALQIACPQPGRLDFAWSEGAPPRRYEEHVRCAPALVSELIEVLQRRGSADASSAQALAELLLPVPLRDPAVVGLRLRTDAAAAVLPWELVFAEAAVRRGEPPPGVLRVVHPLATRSRRPRAGALLMSDPDTDGRFPPSPIGRKRADALAQILGNNAGLAVTFRAGERARPLMNELLARPWRVLAISGPTLQTAGDPEEGGAFVLSDGALLGLRELQAMAVLPELLLLDGDGMGGLGVPGQGPPRWPKPAARAPVAVLLDAGVTAVVAPAWPVDDTTTNAFVTALVQSLASGAALETAARDARRASQAAHPEGADWAAWRVWGPADWRLQADAPAPEARAATAAHSGPAAPDLSERTPPAPSPSARAPRRRK